MTGISTPVVQHSRLSESTQRVLVAIRRLYRVGGVPPSFREIQDEIGFGSSSVVSYHVRKLADAGLISYSPGAKRTIVPVMQTEVVVEGTMPKSWQTIPNLAKIAGRHGRLVFEELVEKPSESRRGRLMSCPRCDTRLTQTYTDEPPSCVACGFVDYRYDPPGPRSEKSRLLESACTTSRIRQNRGEPGCTDS